MTRVFKYDIAQEKKEDIEITSLDAIEIMEQWSGGAKPYLDFLCTQNSVTMMGTEIRYEGDFPHEWKVYKSK